MADDRRERWWTASEDRVHELVFQAIRALQDDGAERIERMERLAMMYGGRTYAGAHSYFMGSSASGWFAPYRRALLPEDRITLNVVRSVIDTATSRYARNARRAMFLTRGGTYEQQERAKTMGKFVDGVKRESGYDDESIVAFRDGALFGTTTIGIEPVKVDDKERVRLRSWLPQQTFVDNAEGWRRAPRQKFAVDFVTREELLARYPEKEAEIDKATLADLRGVGPNGITDLVAVGYAWHLPSGGEAEDGRRVVCVDGASLTDKPWTWPTFQDSVFRYSVEPDGYWGVGIAETIRGIQIEINKLLQRVQEGLRMFAIPRITYEEGTLDERHLRGDDGAIADVIKRRMGSQAPVFWTPPVFPAEVYAHIDRLFEYAHRIAGLTTMATSGQAPTGVTAARALQTLGDLQNDRFRAVERIADRALHVEPARLIVRMARMLAEQNESGYEVMIPGRRQAERIAWKDAQLDEDEFTTEIFPVSKLPTDPVGLLEYTDALERKGYITREVAMRLNETPDIEGEVSYALAALDFADKVGSKLLRGEKVDPPEPADATPLLLARLGSAYQRARTDGVGEGPRGRMMLYMTQVEELIAFKAARAQMQIQAQGAPNVPANGAAAAAPMAAA